MPKTNYILYPYTKEKSLKIKEFDNFYYECFIYFESDFKDCNYEVKDLYIVLLIFTD